MSAKNEIEPAAAEQDIVSTRVFAAPRPRVFAAFRDPAQLARWWGPAGFTNTFQEFDLRPGGKWRFIMRAPTGADYHNESVFTEVTPPERIGFQHLAPVHAFTMTMTFADEAGGTRLTWRMRFDSAAECAKARAFITPANEQNFDRLQAHLEASP